MQKLWCGVALVCLCVSVACGRAEDVAEGPVALPDAPEMSSGASSTRDSGWLKGETPGSEPVQFMVLAGNWVVREEDGERILRVDGREWTPGTEPRLLDDKASALFANAPDAFARRVRQGLKFPYGLASLVGPFTDGDLQVDFKLIAGESDQFASLLFGLGADANHYAFRYNTKDGDTALWRVVDGERERIHHGGVHVDVPLGEWRTLRLRMEGTQLTGWVDDVQTLTYTLPAPVRGRVGLWSKADSVTDYRNLRIIRP